MEKINVKKVCRTCITEQENMLSICNLVNCNGTSIEVIKMLNCFVSTKITEEDEYPSSVCTNCVDLAVGAYNFKLQCDQSQVQLENYMKNISVKTETDINESIENNFNNNIHAVNVTIKEESTNFFSTTNDESVIEQKKPLQTEKVKRKYVKRNLKTKKHSKNTKLKLEEVNPDGAVAENQILTGEVQDADKQITKELSLIYFCSQCNKSFKNKYIFNAHEKRHEFKGQFLCNVCGKGFSSQSCLNRHNRVHTGEKKYECIECHKRFPSSNNLNLHSRIHSGHKPYLCTVCGKRFSHPTGLTYHMRTHTHEKPYGCELCGKRFAIQCHFDRHKKTHSGERPFGCKQCSRAFIKKIDLQRHEEIHSGLKPHSCSICKKSFLRLKNLNYHMMLHTEERPHICTECGKGFIRSYYLRDHIRKHHK